MTREQLRRTRVTLRCLREDLGLDLPPVEIDLGGLDHVLLGEARRVAPTAPRGQKRILSIEHPLIYRVRHGRWRGATWLESDAARFWLCAGAQRADAANGSIGSALAEALNHRDRDMAISFAGLVDARLHVATSGDEVWVAIATQATDGRFVEERLRDVLFGLVLTAAEAELWEPRADWPSGELAWFEVARLGLRESPSCVEDTPPTR